MTTAAIYLRISKDSEGLGLGVARQEQDARRLCEQRGWEVGPVFTDSDISAYSGATRPAYLGLLDSIEQRQVGAVVAYHPDRLHRSPVELEHFITLVDQADVRVETVASGLVDLGTASGRMSARIVGAVARAESERSSERIKRKKDQLAEDGVFAGGARPFGYQDDRVTIDKAEAKILKESARRVLAGDSLTGIAHDFNDRGIPTTRGRQWSATTLRSILINPRHAGMRVHRGVVTGKAVWQPIIDRRTHERLVALLTDPERRRKNPARRGLLTGLVRCGLCGESMTTDTTKEGRKILTCKRGPGRANCGRVSIHLEPTVEIITEAVIEAIDGPRLAKRLAKGTKADDGAADDLAEVEARLADLADLFADGSISKTEWMRARGKLEKRLDKAKDALNLNARPEVLAGFDGKHPLRDTWKTLPLDRQRAIVGAVVENVTIGPVTGPRRTYDPERISITWSA